MSGSHESLFGRFRRFLAPRRRAASQVKRLAGGSRSATELRHEPGRFEMLEARRLLALTTEVPSIRGTVFVDINDNDTIDAGEEVPGATLQLFLDDGDGIFETNGDDVQVGSDQVTDANGDYCFDNIEANQSYFVVQPTQVASGFSLSNQVSSLQLPGSANLVIDTFDTNQEVSASPPAPSSNGSNLTFANETEVIGAERDLFVELISGVGEVELIVNPFNLLPVLQFNSASGVEGRAVITWDGQDGDSSTTPSMGLGGTDLTQNGLNTGISMNLGIDDAGQGDQVQVILYQGNATNTSTALATIPVTDGTAAGFLFIPFSDFSGPVDPSNVDAIQLILGGAGITSADGQIDTIGVLGPKVANFDNEPSVDLAVTKSNATDTVIAGEDISYTITVENLGPLDVTGATVSDIFPAAVQNVSYTSTTTGTVSGNTTGGSGNINDVVDMTAGSSITYAVTGTVAASARGTITNTATVAPPAGLTETNTANNSDEESDLVGVEVDLSITKDDGVSSVVPGDTITYTISVANAGPSDVTGATVTDVFPDELTNVTYTSSTTGAVSGNTASGAGDISDTVDMAVGSSITYTVTATVAAGATGTITNTASVTAPAGTVELNPDNNTSQDQDTIPNEVDLSITKTDNTDTAIPGESLTYTIVVSNAGPGAANGAVIQDSFPSILSNVTYTSTATGGATGNTASGTGNLSDTVNMPAGSTITYTVTGDVAPTATGSITNTATVTAPQSVVETNLDNNSDDDVDTIRPTVDLSVTKTDNETDVENGQQLTYTVVVRNDGPSTATGATFTDNFPAELTSVSYTSVTTGGATGNTAAGSGSIDDSLTLPPNSTVTYTVSATVADNAVGTLTNTATVAAPANVTETNTGNNQASDTDTIIPEVDLAVTKTNNTDVVFAGGETTYTIVVTNSGPAAAVGALITDTLPSQITSATHTSVASGGATGNSNGSGSIADTVTMPAGSSITYTVVAQIDADATGQLQNGANVTAPAGTIERNTTNNTATDTDTIELQLAQLSGFVYVDSNDNGIFETNESPIPGVTVTLRQNNVDLDAAVTDTNGLYAFTDLVPGDYTVVETQPEDYRDGRETAAGGIGSVIANDTFAVTLEPGANATQLNFGELSRQPSKRSLLASAFNTT